MLNITSRLKNNLNDSMKAKQELIQSAGVLQQFEAAVTLVIDRYKSGGRLYVAGNGGSAADAQHLVAEFVSKLNRERHPLPAEALTVDTSIITAIANDYGFEFIFSRQLAGKATKKDIFLGITTSGNSSNILEALKQCRAMGIPSIVFSGKSGGYAQTLADHCIVVSGERTSTIQETHIALVHTLCECVEDALLGNQISSSLKETP